MAGHIVDLDIVGQDDHPQLFFQLGRLLFDNLNDGVQFSETAGNEPADFDTIVQNDLPVDYQPRSSGKLKIVVLFRLEGLETIRFSFQKTFGEHRGPFKVEFGQIALLGIEKFQKTFRNPIPFGVQQGCDGHIKLRRFENHFDIGFFRLKEGHFRQTFQ